MNGIIAEILVSVPAGSIAAAPIEIQRNIISERVLRCPRSTASTPKAVPHVRAISFPEEAAA